MSITQHTGNALDIEKGILVHGCNCQGAMGSGIAWAIRKKWPAAYEIYKNHERTVGLHLGDIAAIGHPRTWADDMGVQYQDSSIPKDIIIVDAMTQYDCGGGDTLYVDYDAISACFARIKILAKNTGLAVHFPLIGCGLANGKWEEVGPRIEAALGPDIEKHLWILPQ